MFETIMEDLKPASLPYFPNLWNRPASNRSSWAFSVWPLLMLLLAVGSISGNFLQAQVPQADHQQPVDASWIWSPRQSGATASTVNEVYFRKRFTLVRPQVAELSVAAGDEYELYINGQLVAHGQSYGAESKIDPIDYLKPGVNLVAVRVRHITSDKVGLALKLRIKEKNEKRFRVLRTDETWKSYTAKAVDWHKNGFSDRSWLQANRVPNFIGRIDVAGSTSADSTNAGLADTSPVGAIGSGLAQNKILAPVPLNTPIATATPPLPTPIQLPASADRVADTSNGAPGASLQTKTATNPFQQQSAFVPPSRFASQQPEKPTTKLADSQVPPAPPAPQTPAAPPENLANRDHLANGYQLPDDQFVVQQVLPGSETGDLTAIAFNEFGELLMARENGPLLLADISSTGNESVSIGLCCDEVNACQAILPLNGDVFVTADGPDGFALYRLRDVAGDRRLEVFKTLLKFSGTAEDSGAHGIRLGSDGMIYMVLDPGTRIQSEPAPTSPYQFAYWGDLTSPDKTTDPTLGSIVRVSLDGKQVETVASGIQRARDLVFDENGDLFVHDAGSVPDAANAWDRPAAIYHAHAGADLGYRSSTSKFAQHHVDQTPAVCSLPAENPAGATIYRHYQFPEKYHNVMFFADESTGKIQTFTKRTVGASHAGQTEPFLQGDNLKIRDLAIGQSGSLYFCSNGSDRGAGVFQVTWTGNRTGQLPDPQDDIAQVIRQPQPNTAWARQNLAQRRREMGPNWDEVVLSVVTDEKRPSAQRVVAADLMTLYGPQPTPEIIDSLKSSRSPTARAAAVRLCSTESPIPSDRRQEILISMLEDTDAGVRRRVCEELLRIEQPVGFEPLIPILKSLDRVESATARRLLERIPASTWAKSLVESGDQRLFVQSGLAMMTAQPSIEAAYQVLAEGSRLCDGFVNDRNFVDILRVMQLAMEQGKVDPVQVPAFAARIGEEFPTNNSVMNMELVKMMAYLKTGGLNGRVEQYLTADSTSQLEKLHAMAFAGALQIGENLTNSNPKENAVAAVTESTASVRNETTAGDGLESAAVPPAPTELTIPTIPAAPAKKSSLGDIVVANDFAPVKFLSEKLANADAANQQGTRETAETKSKNIKLKELAQRFQSYQSMPAPLTAAHVADVISIDQEIKSVAEEPASIVEMRRDIVTLLSRDNTEAGMEYLRKTWESETDRRAEIAVGLSKHPDGDNWSYLISSLPIIGHAEQETAREILSQLARVPRRPRAPIHYRNTIELGYRLAEPEPVDKLLSYWTGENSSSTTTSPDATLAAWTDWYASNYAGAEPVRTPQVEAVGTPATRVAEQPAEPTRLVLPGEPADTITR